MSSLVKVAVGGQELTIRTQAKSKYVKHLASFVSKKIEEIRTAGRTRTTQSLALLAAMNIADELHQLKESQQQLKRQVREHTEKILHTLDTAANN